MSGTNAIPKGWIKDEKTKTGKCHQCNQKIRGELYSYQCVKCKIRVCSACIEQTPDRDQYDKVAVQWHLSKHCWCSFDGGIDPKFIATHGTRTPQPRIEEERRARESKGLPPLNQTTKAKKQNKRSGPNVRHTASPGPAGGTAPQQPGRHFEASHDLMSTISAEKPRRQGLKRKYYYEGGSDDGDLFMEVLPGNGRKRKRDEGLSSSLQGATTVIVGAGIVGLCIARELAMETKRAGFEHRIVVIELRKSYCELASGHCAGFLSTTGMPKDWQPLANEARQWWYEIISSFEIRERLHFNTAIQVTEGGPASHHNVPSWLRQDAGLSLSGDANAVGRIDPIRLAEWLYSQCREGGVDFRFNHEIFDIDCAADGTCSHVWIQSTTSDDISGTKLPCDNLILAAGPFTTGIFNKHFENTPLELENHVQGSLWFHVATTAVAMRGSEAALRLPHAAEADRRLGNGILMVPNVSEKVIAISGFKTRIEDEDLDFSLAQEPGGKKTRELRDIAAGYLDAARVGVKNKSNIVDRGLSQLSVANSMRPIIARVPSSGVSKHAAAHPQSGSVSGGVWLCYGFGKYGTMLAPGAAKILLSKMFDKRSEAVSDEDMFGIPGYVGPQARVKGKGKEKAR